MRPAAWLLLASVLAPTPPLAGQSVQVARIEGRVTRQGLPVDDAVVFLVPADGRATPETSPERAVIDQRDLSFVPAVVAVSPGSTVAFPNSDPVLHNVFHPGGSSGPPFNLGTYPGTERRAVTFEHEGVYVILCHVHPEMSAYVVVTDSPYRAVSDEDGRFAIDDIVPGHYRVKVWHRRAAEQEFRVVLTPGELRAINPALAGPRRRRGSTPGTNP